MGKIDGVSVIAETEDRVLRADDLEEEAIGGATTTGDIVEEDGKITVLSVAEVLDLSPRVVFWNEDDNSFMAVAAIPLDVGFDLALRVGRRAKNSVSILTARSSNPLDGFFRFLFDDVPFLVVEGGMVNVRATRRRREW